MSKYRLTWKIKLLDSLERTVLFTQVELRNISTFCNQGRKELEMFGQHFVEYSCKIDEVEFVILKDGSGKYHEPYFIGR